MSKAFFLPCSKWLIVIVSPDSRYDDSIVFYFVYNPIFSSMRLLQ